ncbi:MAG: desulfoferrodoxin [Lachnospiraceae bacterium]|nr:desulfoferrodoxin [Lachnospiraceae bacterium]
MKFFRNLQYKSVAMELTKGEEGKSLTYEEMTAGDSDAATEKHVPVVTKNGQKLTVDIGSVPHPMQAEHSILWVAVETNLGGHWINLSPEKDPRAEIELQSGEEAKTVYIYCDLHGLWKTEM